MTKFNEVLEMAQQSKNESIYTFFDESDMLRFFRVAYKDTPEALFNSLFFGKNTIRTSDGLLFINRNKLQFRKKYARSAKVVTSVTFNICGYKRKTTHLPAGVLVYGIKFFVDGEKAY